MLIQVLLLNNVLGVDAQDSKVKSQQAIPLPHSLSFPVAALSVGPVPILEPFPELKVFALGPGVSLSCSPGVSLLMQTQHPGKP